jgi:hypothetical protein
MDVELTVGLFVLFLALAVGAFLVILVARFARKTESLIEAMAHSAFLPEKRRRYIGLLSLEGSLLLGTALAWSLTLLGVVPPSIGNSLVTAFLVAGASTVAALTWVGLRPARLTEADREELRRAAPQILGSLFLAPYYGPFDATPMWSPSGSTSRQRRR